MIVSTVYNQLITTLDGSGNLDYIKQVFKGIRYKIEPDSLPCIMVEPVQDMDVVRDLNEYKNINFSVDVIGVAYNPTDLNTAIVGDANYKGILDISNDIRATLQSSNTLGGVSIDLDIQESTFDPRAEDILDIRYPSRFVIIPVSILYRQKEGV